MTGESDSSEDDDEINKIYDDSSGQLSFNASRDDEQFVDYADFRDEEEILPTVSLKYVFLFVILVVGIAVVSTLLAQLLITFYK